MKIESGHIVGVLLVVFAGTLAYILITSMINDQKAAEEARAQCNGYFVQNRQEFFCIDNAVLRPIKRTR